jgi:hypothetical protein
VKPGHLTGAKPAPAAHSSLTSQTPEEDPMTITAVENPSAIWDEARDLRLFRNTIRTAPGQRH